MAESVAGHSTVELRKNALIAIVGATGTGKSQLAVDLALKFNGEIINSDAMQIYKGLPIITNKITTEEQRGVPHHLLSCVSLDEEPWRVGTFVANALDVIDGIRQRGKLPILVGGTHYYVQSLLFENSLTAGQDQDQEQNELLSEDSAQQWPILEASVEEMQAKLQEVDPVMASRWHPNDRRKIRRSLEIWLKTGKKASDTYIDQAQQLQNNTSADTSDSPGQTEQPCGESTKKSTSPFRLRFPTLVLWTHSERDILRRRLDDRIDKMGVNDGLVDEALELYDFQLRQKVIGRAVDLTRGIFVSIGFKEFLRYLQAERQGDLPMLELEKLKAEGYELTKIATRQYVKFQTRWIRIKLANALRDADAAGNMFVIDTSKPDNWAEACLQTATDYVHALIYGRKLPTENNLHLAGYKDDYVDLSRRQDLWQRQLCETCNVTTLTQKDWEQHISSNRHKKAKSKKNAREQRNKFNTALTASEKLEILAKDVHSNDAGYNI